MPRGPELTEFTRGQIIGCHKCDLSIRGIAEKLQVPKSSVANVIMQWRKEGQTSAKKHPGRPSTMTPRDRRVLRRVVKQNRMKGAETITEEFNASTGLTVCSRTVRTELHKMGYTGRAAAFKPKITAMNAKRRLQWCTAHAEWTPEQWKQVVWSDESRYALQQSDGRVWVWRMPGERHLPECVVPTTKFGGGTLMVWGCFGWFGVGPLVVVKGNMNTVRYLDVLDNSVVPTMWQFFGDGPFTYQHDNAPCHTSRAVQNWFEDSQINLLHWPAQSPDLNPIEHLWDELERRVRARPTRPTNLQELECVLLDEWKAIPVTVCQNLVESMHRRVSSAIAAKGGPTRY